MALGIRDYYLFISYLDFKVCAEQGLSDICVCIISMSRAKVSSCGCQALPPTSLLFPPRVLHTRRSSPVSPLLSPFQLRLASLFPRKPFSLPSPRLFQPLQYTSALPPLSLHLSPCAFPSPLAVPAAEARPLRLAPTEEWGLIRRQLRRRCFFAVF